MKLNSILILLFSLTWVSKTSASVYFQKGMVWEMRMTTTAYPDYPDWIVTAQIENDTLYNDEPAMVLSWQNDDNDETGSMLIKVDGEKVYFMPVDKEIFEWYLFYDFGLAPGEGCYVYRPGQIYADGNPYRTYIKCTGIKENDPAFDGWDTMSLMEYSSEECDDIFPQEGIWIKGLASENGVLENNRFGMDGGGSTLLRAILNGEVIYEKGSASIKDLEENTGNYKVYNINGVKVLETKDKSALESLPSGLYIIIGKKTLIK